MTRRGRRAVPWDRNDVLFRVGAFTVAALSLWLAVVVLMRQPLLGAMALAGGIISGVALAFAQPDPPPDPQRDAVPYPDTGRAGGATPSGGRAGQEPGWTAPPPNRVGAAAGSPDRPGARTATALATRTVAVSDGHVLGTGSSAGRAPWRMPVRAGQAGIAADAMLLGDLEVRAASVIGPAHRCREPAVARQDAYMLARDGRGEHLVIAVADGLSASSQSELGARVAVSTAARELTAALDRLPDPDAIDVAQLFTTVAREITGTGRGRGATERDLCCLLVVAVVPTGPAVDGSRQVWTAQVGDVSVWTHGARWCQAVGAAKAGFDRNVVDAVLPFHPDAAVRSVVTVPPGHGVAVLTDGVGDLLNDVAGAQEFFARRWAAPPAPATFLAELCVDAPGQDDDRTAVVVWCGAGGRAVGSR